MTVAPPNSRPAEESVVGKMLAHPNVATAVIATGLTAEDFYHLPMRLLFVQMVEAHWADDPIDALVIGEAAQVPMAKLLRCPSSEAVDKVVALSQGQEPGGAEGHAQVVKRHSDQRRLLHLAASIERSIEEERQSPHEIAGGVATDAMKIATDRALTREIIEYGQLGRNFIRQIRIEKAARDQGVELGVNFGLEAIDHYTGGIKGSELLFIAGEPGVGKALSLDTPLPTPWGWTTMGEVQPGWEVLSDVGRPISVEAATVVMLGRPCYRVGFSDGSAILADEEHEWLTTSRNERQRGDGPSVKTTAEIRDSMKRCDGGWNHVVAVAAPLDLPTLPLPVAPYVLGAWLGDGRTRDAQFTCVEPELVENIEAQGYDVEPRAGMQWRIVGLGDTLAQMGLLGAKRIPGEYLRADEVQRVDLLGGLIDTDGHVDHRGRVEISVLDPELAGDVLDLALGLGLKATLRKTRAILDGRFAGWRHRIGWRSERSFARLSRKQMDVLPARPSMWGRRYVTSVSAVPSRPVRCIQVAGGVYLAGPSYVPTHNSGVTWAAAQMYAERQVKRPEADRIGTLILSLEMAEQPSNVRLAQILTGIDGSRMRKGEVTNAEITRITNEWAARQHLPFWFNFTSTLRASALKALVTEAVRRHNVGLVVIDHFRYFDMDQRHKDPNVEDEEKARFLKESLAKDLDVAVVCLAHTTKGIDTEDGRPRLKHLRGSGQVAAHADFVAFLYRPWPYASDLARQTGSVRPTDAELIWSKNRMGEENSAPLFLNLAEMKVKDAP